MQKTNGFSESFPEYTRILQNFSRSKIFKSNKNQKSLNDNEIDGGPEKNTDLLTTLVQSQEDHHVNHVRN